MWNKRLNAHETQIRSLKTASAKGGIRAAAILSSAQVLTLRLFFLFPPGSSLPPSSGAPPPPAPSASPGLPQVLGGRPGVGRARARRLARDQYRLHQGHSSRGSRPLASLPPPLSPCPAALLISSNFLHNFSNSAAASVSGARDSFPGCVGERQWLRCALVGLFQGLFLQTDLSKGGK